MYLILGNVLLRILQNAKSLKQDIPNTTAAGLSGKLISYLVKNSVVVCLGYTHKLAIVHLGSHHPLVVQFLHSRRDAEATKQPANIMPLTINTTFGLLYDILIIVDSFT